MDLTHIRALIFDLDGTLIDSEKDLVNSANAMLREVGRPEKPPATISSYIGHGAAKLCSSALGPDTSPEEQTAGLEIFLRHYAEHKLDFTRAYAGVPEALARLNPMAMAVFTNKPQQMSVQILEALELAKYFTVIYGGDSFPAKKPDPTGVHKILELCNISPVHALFIGDSDVDVLTARNAGTAAAIMNYGFGQHDRVAHPADVYLDGLVDLVPLLRTRTL